MAGMLILGEDLPQSGNRVTLDPKVKDAHGFPVPHLHVDDHPNDLAMRKHAHTQATRLYEAVGAKRVIRGNGTPSAHNMGTARMSADPRDGVTNAWGQTHDIPNLFVSDGSLLSSSGSANPTLTIVALVLRQAEYIAREMSAGTI
jgi:choline dehydrogenase-like flavoprotein